MSERALYEHHLVALSNIRRAIDWQSDLLLEGWAYAEEFLLHVYYE